jgi:hypothetical protein
MSVFGWWPMAMKQPVSLISAVAASCVLRIAIAGDARRVAEHLVERRRRGAARPCRLDLGHQLVDQDRLGAELVAAVHDVHLRGDVREVERLLDRGVAAADARDLLAAVEEAVAGGAAAHAACP